MNKTLRYRLTWAFIGVAAGIVLVASFIFIVVTHYHFLIYQEEYPDTGYIAGLNYHFELALIQSTLWTALGAVVLAIVLSWFVARRITAPLVLMRKRAEDITKGNLQSRVPIHGRDEIAELGQALNHLTEELQRQENLRKQMTSDVAHELRTPLATLKSHMEAFEDGIWEPTPKRLQAVTAEIDRLIGLVGDMQQLTLLESPEFELERKEEDLSKIVEHTLVNMRTSFNRKGVSLQTENSGPVYAFVDRRRLIQVLVNLLSNALKSTPHGGVVTVQTEQQEEEAVLTVQDTGEGIPQAELQKIFERFYRVDRSRNRQSGGSGIGLTIVKKLVESHEGTIRIKSTPDTGTSIQVYLPSQK
ncbi:sensor histidine kinase [Desmospora activa]|uniref:histidine kinase n=1 Tax=Desmospora activa DSM 45169 TaxID=1121389 RepID=A0A2T4Z9Q2_9BACL|nr:ATP-binding protein [Desmospora activa]PTM58619.1 signal transduction histidine kinase [Desmospora activa DSM 45169]